MFMSCGYGASTSEEHVKSSVPQEKGTSFLVNVKIILMISPSEYSRM